MKFTLGNKLFSLPFRGKKKMDTTTPAETKSVNTDANVDGASPLQSGIVSGVNVDSDINDGALSKNGGIDNENKDNNTNNSKKSKKKIKFNTLIVDFVSGKFITKDRFVKQIPFLFFLFFLLLVYVNNIYSYNMLLKELSLKKEKLKILRIEAIELESELKSNGKNTAIYQKLNEVNSSLDVLNEPIVVIE